MKSPKEKGKNMKNPTDLAVLLHRKASQTSVCIRRYISIHTHTPESIKIRGTWRRESWKVFEKHEEVGIELRSKLLAGSKNNRYATAAPVYAALTRACWHQSHAGELI